MKPESAIRDYILKLFEEGKLDTILRIGIAITREDPERRKYFVHQRGRLHNSARERDAMLGHKQADVERNQIAFWTLEAFNNLPDKFFANLPNQFWRSIYEYVPPHTKESDWGIEVIKYVNRNAGQLLLRKSGEDPDFIPEVWQEIFHEEEIYAQSKFVDTRERNTNEYVRQKIFRLLNEGIQKIWVIGEPGVGKTTTLYNIFLHLIKSAPEAETKFVPILLQPQELNKQDLDYMQSVGEDKDKLFYGILKTWLKKRSLNLDPEDEEIVIRQIVRHLKSGNEVIVLMDSYDELSRMKIQVEIFTELFRIIQRFICASRPETHNESLEGLVLTIKSPWDIVTITSYLDQRLMMAPEVKEILIRSYAMLIGSDHRKEAKWLRNPRYINLILNGLNRGNYTSKKEIQDLGLTSYLKAGEYNFCRQIFLMAFERVHRMPVNAGKWNEEKVRELLRKIAYHQLNYGNYILSNEEFETEEAWSLVLMMTELVDTPILIGNLDARQIRLHNQNFVDLALTRKLAAEILDPNATLFISQFWSTNLLTFLAEYYHEFKHEKEQIKREIIKKLKNLKIKSEVAPNSYQKILEWNESGISFETRFLPVNLVHLLLSLEKVFTGEMKLNGMDFQNLNLYNLNLKGALLHNCRFDRSVLAFADLEKTMFLECSFEGTNLRNASASEAIFKLCKFDFTYGDPKDSPVQNIVIQNTIIEFCETPDPDFEPVEGQSFIEFGGIGRKSRYSSSFGRKFFENMGAMLGPGLGAAENTYRKYIEKAIKEHHSDEKFYLVDLMSGGSNKRLNSLFGKYKNQLFVMGIDRDTTNTEDLVNKVGEQFAPVTLEIQGTCDLKNLAATQLKGCDGTVHLIIGKKALHEINRSAQEELITECASVLKPGGHLILFADAPLCISASGFQRFENIRHELVRNYQNISYLEEFLTSPRSPLDFSQATEDDCAIFSNLWIMLKDLANDNLHEFKNRYFSSLNELTHWGVQAGLELMNDPIGEQEGYYLNAKLFNEWGINQAGTLLEHSNKVTEENEPAIVDCLAGKNRPLLQLLWQFSQIHLLDEAYDPLDPHSKPAYTALGQKLQCKISEVNFGILDNRLDNINLPPEIRSGVAFRFSVHILVLKKPILE